MKRGDIITVSAPGDYGNPRPAVVVQSDRLRDADSVLVSLITSTIRPISLFRLLLHPSSQNGLKSVSQIMVDKIYPIPRSKCGKVIGRLDEASIITLNGLISVVFGLAD